MFFQGMRATQIVIVTCLLYELAAGNDSEGRQAQPRGLVHRSQLNAVLRPTAEDRTETELVDPQIVVDQNITFHDIGCVVGRACSRIIQPNLPKSPKPTFKPYVKNDRNHFKGTLSMLYPPRTNGSSEAEMPSTRRTTPPPLTPTDAPKTTPKNVWVVRPQKKIPSPAKEDKKTAVIDNIINLLKEISANPKPSQIKEAQYAEKHYSKQVSKAQDVKTTTRPRVTEPPNGGVAVYRKPSNNLYYHTTKDQNDKDKRPVMFSNNKPIYEKEVTTSTSKPLADINEHYSWLDSLLQASKKNMLGQKTVDVSNSVKEPKNPASDSKTDNLPFITWTAQPVSSYYNPPVQKEPVKNEVVSYTSNQKILQKAKPEIASKVRPYIVTAEELRKRREEEEERLRLERLKKQAQTLKPFIVSASFGFDSKRARSMDMNNSFSEKLTVLPARGRSIIRDIGGHSVETSADATNLTKLIMETKLPKARSMQFQPDSGRSDGYFSRYQNPGVNSESLDSQNLTALIFSHEIPKPVLRNPQFFDRYVSKSDDTPRDNMDTSNLTALILSHEVLNRKPSSDTGANLDEPNIHRSFTDAHRIRQNLTPSTEYFNKQQADTEDKQDDDRVTNLQYGLNTRDDVRYTVPLKQNNKR